MTKYISIDRTRIATNREIMEEGLDGPLIPPICIEWDINDQPSILYAFGVSIQGPCRVVYRPHHLEPGDPQAHAWVQVADGVPLTYTLDSDRTKTWRRL